MKRPSISPGTARLRQRFITRAGVLSEQEEFRTTLTGARRWWNKSFPEYRIEEADRGRTTAPGRLIAALERSRAPAIDVDLVDSLRRMVAEAPANDASPAVSQAAGLLTQLESDPAYRVARAVFEWERMLALIAAYFWPPMDFPHPYPIESHPATGFIAASLYLTDVYDRLSEKEIDECFPAFDLVPRLMPTNWEEALARRRVRDMDPAERPCHPGTGIPLDLLRGEPGAALCLPLFPGLTADLLHTNARDIAQAVEMRVGHLTTEARVHALRKAGLSQKKIGERLGLPVTTVSRMLKHERIVN